MKNFIKFVMHSSMYGSNTLATACIIAILLTFTTIAGGLILAMVVYPVVMIPLAVSSLFGYILFNYWKQK